MEEREVAVPAILTSKEVAAYLQKSENWLERGRIEGYGPAYVKVGRSVRYFVPDVLAWLHNRQTDPSKER